MSRQDLTALGDGVICALHYDAWQVNRERQAPQSYASNFKPTAGIYSGTRPFAVHIP